MYASWQISTELIAMANLYISIDFNLGTHFILSIVDEPAQVLLWIL